MFVNTDNTFGKHSVFLWNFEMYCNKNYEDYDIFDTNLDGKTIPLI